MHEKKDRVLIMGLATTGISVAKELYLRGNKIILNDINNLESIRECGELLKNENVSIVTGSHPMYLAKECDYIVISPGIPLDLSLIKEAKKLGKEVISEIELAYRLTKSKIAAITGTNGKTTTTSLLGYIVKKSERNVYVVGNIGEPMIGKINYATANDIFVLEVSSFQLESTFLFRPHISAILNITPDHLNRHKTMENYIDTKCKVFKNQTEADFTILNKDDKVTLKLASKPTSKVLLFSRNEVLQEGAFIKDGYLKIAFEGKERTIIKTNDIYIQGKHNIENALAASLMAYCLGVEAEFIKEGLKEFKGVPHRLEYVCDINGVEYYNDSKGTNPDSSIKAIEAINKPIILIAGGIDKGSSFESFVKAFKKKAKALILIGETAAKIENQAKAQGFTNIYKAKELEEAVLKAKNISLSGDVVLLSPACASWDMFKSFEERGNLFKSIVKKIGEDAGDCQNKK